MNTELRSGDLRKIKKYIPLIYKAKLDIFNGVISSYNEIVYRVTSLKPEFINKLKIRTILFNPCFLSCSKKIEKAMEFLINYKRNVLFVINGIYCNNIDIDEDKLSYYPNEEEVLILPFSSFLLKDIRYNEEKYSYYIIYLENIKTEFNDDEILNLPKYESKY